MADALARCVGDVDAFVADHWAQQPRLTRGADKDGYADLLSIGDVDGILTSSGLRSPAFRLIKDGTPLPASSYLRTATIGSRRVKDLADASRVLEEFADGATIVLQGLHRSWPPLADFCHALEQRLTHPVQANAYLTPPTAAGLDIHHDTHDVFVLHVHGRKQWVTYRPVTPLAVPSQRLDVDAVDRAQPTLDTVLEPGDCLYLPRGTPHAARTSDEPSLHVTVGIRASTWLDLFRVVLEDGAEDLTYRRPLPPGFAHDPDRLIGEVAARLKDFASWWGEQDATAVARRAAERFWNSRRPVLDGQLVQLLRLGGVGDETVVQPRPGQSCRLRHQGDRIVIALADRDVLLPEAVSAAVRRLTSGEPVRVGELAETLDTAGRQVLVRRLVREGVLVIRE